MNRNERGQFTKRDPALRDVIAGLIRDGIVQVKKGNGWCASRSSNGIRVDFEISHNSEAKLSMTVHLSKDKFSLLEEIEGAI